MKYEPSSITALMLTGDLPILSDLLVVLSTTYGQLRGEESRLRVPKRHQIKHLGFFAALVRDQEVDASNPFAPTKRPWSGSTDIPIQLFGTNLSIGWCNRGCIDSAVGPASSGFPPGPACTPAGFKIVSVPQTVVHFPLHGAMPGQPAHPAILRKAASLWLLRVGISMDCLRDGPACEQRGAL